MKFVLMVPTKLLVLRVTVLASIFPGSSRSVILIIPSSRVTVPATPPPPPVLPPPLHFG